MRSVRAFPHVRALAACAAAAALLGAAGASGAAGREVTALWEIQSSGSWSEPREIAKGDPLVELDILPPALIELSEDMSGGGVEGLLRQGDLLYRLNSQSGAVYCTVDGQPMINNEARFSHTILVCLVDADSDGTFDGHYRKPAAAGIPLIFGEVPARLKPVGPVRYESRPPSTLAGQFRMRILLDSDPAKSRRLRFTYGAGDPKGTEAGTIKLATITEVANGPYPQRFEILGGFLELTGVSNGKAVIRMVSPTTLYPFMVEPGTVRL